MQSKIYITFKHIHIPVRFYRDLKADLTVKIFNCGYTSIQELKTTSLFHKTIQTH